MSAVRGEGSLHRDTTREVDGEVEASAVKNETNEMIISRIDSPYHTLRVAMNGKLVAL